MPLQLVNSDEKKQQMIEGRMKYVREKGSLRLLCVSHLRRFPYYLLERLPQHIQDEVRGVHGVRGGARKRDQ
jgi:hypothetical protein